MEIKRRSRMDLMTPAERAILEANWAVEKAGCDPLLTEAQNLLHKAREMVADFVDRELARAEDEARARRSEDDTKEVPV